MEVDEALAQLGGVATRRQLLRSVDRRALQRAVTDATVVRVRRGRFALEAADAATSAAARLGGQVACLSAAQAAGWEVVRAADRPWVAVPRHRSGVDTRGVHLLYSDDRESDPVRVVLQCARRLPGDEALAVADSALRSGQLEQDDLVTGAAALRGPGSRAARRVADLASPLKANVLESVLHWQLHDVPGLDLVPQLAVELGGLTLHPDLADPDRRIAVEAEGWLFHGSTPESFDRDVRRYTLLVAHGWIVLRFTHHQVMHEPEYVREMVELALTAGTTGRKRRRSA